MSEETAAMPAVLFDIILSRLELFCFSGQVGKFLHRDPDLRSLALRCQHVAFVKDTTELGYNIPVSINVLTRAFDSQ
jgi:hypothetical protein